jgi:transcriptional regulator with XRE-family HTH domain
MSELAVRASRKLAHLGEHAFPLQTIGSYHRGVTVNIPTEGLAFIPFVVRVPTNALSTNSAFGAIVVGAIPRTQSLSADQHRIVLLTLARSFGEVWTNEAEPPVEVSEQLTEVLGRLRAKAGLPAAEIARMIGIQRRHLYNLADGGSTPPEREQRIRALARFVDGLFERYEDVEAVRSALLAPIETDLRSFVDLATEGASIRDASKSLEDYLDNRSGAVRHYIQPPRRARGQERSAARAIEDTLDISPDQRP